MRLIRLEISGVRNLSVRCDRLLPRTLNLFVGPNGAGKTAILEAVHLLARGRSFRSSTGRVGHSTRAEALIGSRCDSMMSIEVSVSVGLVKHRGNRTELHLNEVPERRLSEVARLMPIQLTLPDSSDLVFGAPQERRRFVDWGTFHVEPSYLDVLRDYQRALHQRNALLRYLKGQQSASTERRAAMSGRERLVALGEPRSTRTAALPCKTCFRWFGRSSRRSGHRARGRDLVPGWLARGRNVGRLFARKRGARCKIRTHALRAASRRPSAIGWRHAAAATLSQGPGEGRCERAAIGAG